MAEGYKVTDVQQTTRYIARSKEEIAYTVTIETDKGVTGRVSIPASEYEKSKVIVALGALRDKLDLPYSL